MGLSKLPDNLPDLLRAEGLNVVKTSSWVQDKTTGSLDAEAIAIHDDVVTTSSLARERNWAEKLGSGAGRFGSDQPVYNILVSRHNPGTVYLIGKTRTVNVGTGLKSIYDKASQNIPVPERAGSQGQWNSGNKHYVGVCLHWYPGQDRPQHQIDATAKVCKVLLKLMGAQFEFNRVVNHKATTSRKVDSQAQVYWPGEVQRISSTNNTQTSAHAYIFDGGFPGTIQLASRYTTGQNVVLWQRALNDVAGINIDVDGVWGPASDKALRRFQSDAKLRVDGVAGAGTWQALENISRAKLPLQNNNPISNPNNDPTPSRADVIEGYQKYLFRNPSNQDIEFWTAQPKTLFDRHLPVSEEAQQKRREFVIAAYQEILKRTPNENDIAWATGVVLEESRERLMDILLDSPEYKDLQNNPKPPVPAPTPEPPKFPEPPVMKPEPQPPVKDDTVYGLTENELKTLFEEFAEKVFEAQQSKS